ncbi:hypothetical protein ONZ45_g15875 [Pleurotus djamor]|nr:hypothetical protein ONZ45_g15875 [Pleurotus djamor]
MPLLVNPNHDVALEELKLASDMLSIEGRVRLRNISYHKLLAVRFTFDAWQTTSEVMGKYSESINNDFDRFTFSIRLDDLLARIDGKTLLLALRYNTDGREIWDNNSHQNYHAVFSTKRPSKRQDDDSSASDVADLKTRLEKVAKTRENSLKTPSRRSGSRSNSSSSSSSDSDKPLEFKTSASLASRYDLGSSLRAPWKSPTVSYPIPLSAPASSIPWPEKISTKGFAPSSKTKAELGSPRDLSDEERYRILGSPRNHSATREMENIPFPVMNPVPSKDQRSSRIHQRGGYFDIGPKEGLIVKMTPPSSPQSSSIALPSPRSVSFPPTDGSLPRSPLPAPASLDISSRMGLRIQTSNSEDSTPTFVSSSGSSRSSTPSPVESFGFNSLAGPFGETTTSPAGAPVDYHQLIDKFCFYTGVDNLPARSASVSSIDDIFTTQSPRIYGLNSIFNSPPLTTRSNSDDAIVCRSGSATPIAIRTPTPGSRSPTPIAA